MKYRLVLLAMFCCLLIAGPLQAQTQSADGQSYLIQRNDTLWMVAERYYGDGQFFPSIVAATAAKAATDSSFDPIDNPDLIEIGQKVWIPNEPTLSYYDQRSSQPNQVELAMASAAPDGSPAGQIAFSFWNNAPDRCTYEINVIQVRDCLQGPDQCQASRRIFPLNNVSEPALSLDGVRLAFRAWGVPLIGDDEDGDGQEETIPNPLFDGCASAYERREIVHTTLDGTGEQLLFGFFEDGHPDWSPDGNRIIFDSTRVNDGVRRIYAIDRDGLRDRNDESRPGEADLRIVGEQPSFAPDNHRFVYRGCDLTGNRCGLQLAYAVEVPSWETGSNMIGPLLPETEASHPDWSPAGEQIVYQSTIAGSPDLYLIDVDGTNQRRLTNAPGIEGLPAWSPDGQWIAYLAHDGQNWAIRIINRAGTDDRLLFSYDGGFYHLPLAVDPYTVDGTIRDWSDEQISWSR